MAKAKSTQKAIDDDVSEFYYNCDLTIEPPLPDAKAKMKNDHFELKQIKDEDVQLINGEIVVVSNNVTSLKQGRSPNDYAYDYADLKSAILTVAKIAKDAGSNLNGHVVIRDGNDESHRIFRIKVTNNDVTVEAAALGWPDGTSSPWPEGPGA